MGEGCGPSEVGDTDGGPLRFGDESVEWSVSARKMFVRHVCVVESTSNSSGFGCTKMGCRAVSEKKKK